MSRSLIENVRKIAVLRANALGDFIFAQPALAALKAAYPRAELVYLGKPWHADFVAGRPGPVDRVEIVPRYKGVGSEDTWSPETPEESAAVEAQQEQFFARMQAEHFDLALQMHGGGGNSNPFVTRLDARVTAGLRAPGAPPLDRWVRYIYWQHEVLRLIEVAGLVGAPPVMVEPHISVTKRDIAESCDVVSELNQPLVLVHPGASDPRRRWPAERYAEAGDRLARKGCAVAVVGIPSERGVVDAVLSAMRESALDLCGRLSLQALTGLTARAALVIANDSGPRHLAEAVGTPTVGIFWCGNVINAGSAFREKHRPLLSWRIHCPVCGKNTLHDPCPHQESFVDEVTVDEVIDSALDLLNKSNREEK